MKRECDVLVAGGGIAGSLVSYFLASKGFDVVIVEQKDKDDTMKEIILSVIIPCYNDGSIFWKQWKV